MPTIKGDRSCDKCTLAETAQHVCLMGRGRVPCNVMIIGEAPGRREDDIGKPFQGPAGFLLEEILHDNKHTRGNVYITNVVRCRPPKNRTPKIKEIKACSHWMAKEFRLVKPKFIMLMGNSALKAVPEFAKSKITKVRGQVKKIDLGYGPVYCMATFHPAACLPGRDTGRGGKKGPSFRVDFANFFRLVKEGKPKKDLGLRCMIVKSHDDFNKMIEDISLEGTISYDLETMGLNPFLRNKHIVMAALGLRDKQWILPLYHPKSPFKTHRSRQMVMDILGEALQGKKLVAHNGKFDLLWTLEEYNVRLKLKFDTMIAHALLDENSLHGLKYLSSLYFGVPEYGIDVNEDAIFSHSLKSLAKYAALDVFYTRKLSYYFEEKLSEDSQLHKFYHKLLLPAYDMFVDIEKTGVYLDKPALVDAIRKCKKDLASSKNWLDERFPDINWNSPKQVGELFFKQLKLPIIKKTAKGNPSTDESVLLELKAADHEVAKSLLAYRAAQKQFTFVKSWTEKAIAYRMHPSFKFLTVTGRLSCQEPNLQQVPRDSSLRSVISAPPEYDFVEADFSQIELRIAAMYSNDPMMKHVFQTGGDIHRETALIFTHDVKGEDRKKAKAVNFGLIYRMGWRKLQLYAKEKYDVILSDSEAQNIWQQFFTKYSYLPKWHRKQIRLVRANGMVRHPLGRIRHLPEIHSPDEMQQAAAERQAINSPVQGFGSDFNLAAALAIHKRFPPYLVKITGTVHDSCLLWIKKDHTIELLPKIKELMEYPPAVKKLGLQLTVPIVVNFKIGPWGSGYEIKGDFMDEFKKNLEKYDKYGKI